ncbi:MAG: hypothetical protein QOH31_2166, partial [Verrucomicrobiota bacterium]
MRKQAKMIMRKQAIIEVRSIPAAVSDAGKVRLGGESPSFGPVRVARLNTVDKGKVRLG